MELPVLDWQNYACKKWSQLTPCEKANFSPNSDLKESFMACWSQLQQEDEEVVERLCSDLSVEKEPRAVLFYKEEGNKRFGRKQYTAAAALYSKAISHAGPGTEEIAVCFANRSAVLFHLGHYSVCLEDINRAQEHGYPERLKSKILQRQTECLEKLRQSVSSNAKSSRTEGAGLTEDTGKLAKFSMSDKLQELKLNKNLQLSNASSSLSLQFSSSKGRHLVASKDIAQGDLLIWEEAYVSVIIPNRKKLSGQNAWDATVSNCDLYCHHCLQRTLASLPCPHCSFSRYCSNKCMDEAWEKYHYVECSLGSILLCFGIFCQTSLRAVLLAGYRQVSGILSQTLNISALKNASNEHYYSDYTSLINLLAHIEHHKEERKFLYALTSAALCKKLCIDQLRRKEVVTPGEDTMDGHAEQDKILDLQLIGSAILLHMLQLHCNAQAVTVIQEEYEEYTTSLVESNKCVRLATALFPVLSLLNHSCDPNTSVTFQGRCAIVKASRPIRKGEEVEHCYGPHKLRMDRAERRHLLKDQYFFMCQCEACKQEQGSKDNASCDFCCPKCQATLEGEDELRCVTGSCGHSFSRAQAVLRLQNLQHLVRLAREQLQDNHTDVAKRMLLSCLSEGRQFLSQNHMLFGEIFDLLAQAEASKGDWAAATGYLRKSVHLVRQRYGSSSLELGHELFKLAQILFNGQEVADAMDIILRTQHILSLHYGPDHNLLQELQEMKTCLLQLPWMGAALEK
ncbi:SET and MYND domain-containing protein 4 isoform X2 [Pseudophryne corroboree]